MNNREQISIPQWKVWDKVALVLFYRDKVLLCLEPQKNEPLSECLLKLPWWKIESWKWIMKTAQSELRQELGFEIPDEKRFRYETSKTYQLFGEDKVLHLVSCTLTPEEYWMINLDNPDSEKKTIKDENEVSIEVPEIFYTLQLTSEEFAAHKEFPFVTEQVKISRSFILEMFANKETKKTK